MSTGPVTSQNTGASPSTTTNQEALTGANAAGIAKTDDALREAAEMTADNKSWYQSWKDGREQKKGAKLSEAQQARINAAGEKARQEAAAELNLTAKADEVFDKYPRAAEAVLRGMSNDGSPVPDRTFRDYVAKTLPEKGPDGVTPRDAIRPLEDAAQRWTASAKENLKITTSPGSEKFEEDVAAREGVLEKARKYGVTDLTDVMDTELATDGWGTAGRAHALHTRGEAPIDYATEGDVKAAKDRHQEFNNRFMAKAWGGDPEVKKQVHAATLELSKAVASVEEKAQAAMAAEAKKMQEEAEKAAAAEKAKAEQAGRKPTVDDTIKKGQESLQRAQDAAAAAKTATKEELDALRKQLEEKDKENAKLRDENTKLKTELDGVKKQVADQATTLEQMQKAIADLQAAGTQKAPAAGPAPGHVPVKDLPDTIQPKVYDTSVNNVKIGKNLNKRQVYEVVRRACLEAEGNEFGERVNSEAVIRTLEKAKGGFTNIFRGDKGDLAHAIRVMNKHKDPSFHLSKPEEIMALRLGEFFDGRGTEIDSRYVEIAREVADAEVIPRGDRKEAAELVGRRLHVDPRVQRAAMGKPGSSASVRQGEADGFPEVARTRQGNILPGQKDIAQGLQDQRAARGDWSMGLLGAQTGGGAEKGIQWKTSFGWGNRLVPHAGWENKDYLALNVNPGTDFPDPKVAQEAALKLYSKDTVKMAKWLDDEIKDMMNKKAYARWSERSIYQSVQPELEKKCKKAGLDYVQVVDCMNLLRTGNVEEANYTNKVHLQAVKAEMADKYRSAYATN